MALSSRRLCALLLLLVPLAACAPERPPVAPETRNQVVAGRQTGLWTYRWEDGALRAEGAWTDDLQSGLWRWWYRDGTPQQVGGYGAGGLRSGRWRSWHPSGHLASEGAFVADRPDGVWRHWHADGAPAAEGRWERGVRQGLWIARDGAGRPASAGLYVQGLAVGPWLRWKEGAVTVADLGAPAGAVAAWSQDESGTAWTLTASGWTATLAWSPAWVLRRAEVAGQAYLPARIGDFAANLSRLAVQPAPAPVPVATRAEPVAPLVAGSTPATVAPAQDAQLVPDAGAAAPAPAVLPGLWTRAQEDSAPKLLRLFTGADTGPDLYATGRISPSGHPFGRTLIGRRLPQARFLSHAGGVVDVTRSGRPTVLVVMRGFSGQVCLYCASQTAALSNHYRRFGERGADLVIVYPGPVESVPAFVQAVQSLRSDPPPMTVALDVSLLLVRSLGLEDNLARPTSLVLRPDGTIAWAYVGAGPADRPSVEDLLDALSAARTTL